MYFSVSVNFKGHSAFIEKIVTNNTAPYKIPNLNISTSDHNAMEYLSKDYLALYNSSLCEFCDKNNLCLEFKEDSNRKIIGTVNLVHKIKRTKICSGQTIESVTKYIEALIENRNNENNI